MKALASTSTPETFSLQNGLRVFLVENRSTPSIAMNLTVLAGARDESEEFAGTAMMASRLLDEGTETRTSLEIADAIESVGGAIDTDCTFDRFAVFLAVLSRDIDLGLALVADMLRNPVFSPESIDNERQRTLAEIRSAMDRPQVVTGWAFNESVYGAHPLHRPVHGYPESIARIGREQLRAFHSRHVVPGNVLLALVGDFRVSEMQTRLEQVFGSWSSGPPPGGGTGPAPKPLTGVNARFLKQESQQAHIYYGHLGISRSDPEYYALQVMDTILGAGAGLTARIPHKLRDEQGLAYTTFASITSSASSEIGKFLAYIATSPENVAAAIDGFIAEIDRIRSEPVSREELDDARAYLTGSFVFSFESNAQIARFLINAELFGLGFDYRERYPQYIERVTAAMVQKAAATHLSTSNYALVIGGPEQARPEWIQETGGE